MSTENISKIEENHIFTTFDTVSVLGLLVGCLLLIVSIVSNAMVDQRPAMALNKAKHIAKQILLGGYQVVSEPNDSTSNNYARTIASVPKLEIKPSGRLGIDPWGSAFYYRVITDKNDRIKVVVLSTGPDRILNTSEQLLRADATADLSSRDVQGDDLIEIVYE